MFKRVRYQKGSLTREERRSGPDAWVFRYRDSEGVHRKVIIGTVVEYTSKRAALKASERHRININNNGTYRPRTVSDLVTHYIGEELTEEQTANGDDPKSFSTRKAYQSYFENRIIPKWGDYPIYEVKAVEVKKWLSSLNDLAPGTKAKIRNIMRTLFNHAMFHEWLDKNPIKLVRQSAKRQSEPDVLTVEEIRALLSEPELEEPYRTLTFVAVATGLRCSELLGLKWSDIHFESGKITVTRGIVCKVVGNTKTETSKKPLPMSEGLANVLLNWRKETPYNQDSDWVFASAQKRGTKPLWPSSAMSKHIRPAAIRVGITKRVRWHVFRHSFGTLLMANGQDVKTTQELMRHADSKTTLNIYVQAVTAKKREAQAGLVTQLFPCGPTTPESTAASD